MPARHARRSATATPKADCGRCGVPPVEAEMIRTISNWSPMTSPIRSDRHRIVTRRTRSPRPDQTAARADSTGDHRRDHHGSLRCPSRDFTFGRRNRLTAAKTTDVGRSDVGDHRKIRLVQRERRSISPGPRMPISITRAASAAVAQDGEGLNRCCCCLRWPESFPAELMPLESTPGSLFYLPTPSPPPGAGQGRRWSKASC